MLKSEPKLPFNMLASTSATSNPALHQIPHSKRTHERRKSEKEIDGGFIFKFQSV